MKQMKSETSIDKKIDVGKSASFKCKNV